MKTHPARASNSLPYKLLLLGTAMLLATGCNESKKPVTQVAATVNGDEISVHQVNNAMTQLRNVPVDNMDKLRRDILNKLINQQLAVQQAQEQKIDRSPNVMMQIDEAKREILTRTYLNRLIAGLPKPSAADAKQFYDSHPQIFSQRRLYKLQEITLETNNPPVADLKAFDEGKSMEEIAVWLKKRNIAYTLRSGTRGAEQIPLPILNVLTTFKDGQTGILEPTPNSVIIVHLDSSQAAPVDEKTALKQIPGYLANEQARLAVNSDLERLKTKAKIEYMGEFASMSPNQAAQPAPAAAEAEKPQPPKQVSGELNVAKGIGN